jgi:hypothetical protein
LGIWEGVVEVQGFFFAQGCDLWDPSNKTINQDTFVCTRHTSIYPEGVVVDCFKIRPAESVDSDETSVDGAIHMSCNQVPHFVNILEHSGRAMMERIRR